MENFTYKYKITVASQFQPWLIRNYLNRRSVNLLYLVTKIIPVLRIVYAKKLTIMDWVLLGFVFFYFEIVILYKYIMIQSKVKSMYKDNTYIEVSFLENEISFITRDSVMKLPWDEINNVENNRYFYLFYKNNDLSSLLYKKMIPTETINMIDRYVEYHLNQKKIRN
jgi:hypothetical protein